MPVIFQFVGIGALYAFRAVMLVVNVALIALVGWAVFVLPFKMGWFGLIPGAWALVLAAIIAGYLRDLWRRA